MSSKVPAVVLHEQILVEEIDDYPLAVALVGYLTAVRVIPNQLESDRLIRNSNNRADKLVRLLIERLKYAVDYDRLLHVALVGRLRKGYLSELLHLEFTVNTEWNFLKRLSEKISPLWCFCAKELRVNLIDDVITQNPTPAARALHMLIRHCNHLITEGIVGHHTELPKYLASAIRQAIDLINPTRYVPRPGTTGLSLQKLHDSGFIDLDDITVPVYQRKREFTQEDLTRTVDDVRDVVTEELRHCPRDVLVAIESILKVTGKTPENVSPENNIPVPSQNSLRSGQNMSPSKGQDSTSPDSSAEDAYVKMSAIHREALKRNKDVILAQLIYTLPVIDLLYSRGLMDIVLATELRQQPSSSERGEKLLRLMPRLPDEGFYTFCEGLASVGLESVARRLRNSSKQLKAGYK